MQKKSNINNLYGGNFLIFKLYSFNKNSVNSILKKFSNSYFINLKFVDGHIYLLIKLCDYLFIFETNKAINYLKKENIYFSIFGIKNKNNSINYNFFVDNFNYTQKISFKFLIFKTYFMILTYYNLFIKLYFFFCFLFMSNFNFLIFKCLQSNKQLLS